MTVALTVLIVLVVLLVAWVVLTYNGLVAARTKNENAFAQIDVQLNRRHDLIPNLVSTVKGSAAHEQETLDAVVRARNVATAANGAAAKAQAEDLLSASLGRLIAVAEAYPDLKANAGFQQLQGQLAETEDRIAYSRQFFNDNVRIYNEKIQKVPGSLIAGRFGFGKAEYFAADEAQRQNVAVDFDSP